MPDYSALVGSIAQTYRDIGRARAQGLERQAQITGGLISSLAQLPGQVIGQSRQLEQQQEETRRLKLQNEQAERQARDEKALDAAIRFGVNPDGTFNRENLMKGLSEAGNGHLWPLLSKTLDQADEQRLRADRARQELDDANQEYTARLAAGVRAADYDPSALIQAVGHAVANRRLDPKAGQQLMMLGVEGGREKIKPLVDQLIANSPKVSDELRKQAADEAKAKQAAGREDRLLNQPIKLGAGETLIDPNTLQPIASGMSKEQTAGQMDARYQDLIKKKTLKQSLTADEEAEITAYEARKLLGPEAASAAATDRQSRAIAAQIGQQARAQSFSEQQAGRKELSDKVDKPYQDALQSAATLRDVVSAAKAGNKVAASLQSLETTMAAIRAQGLNRINTTEIGATASAGSLWDRIQSKIGSLTAGEPVPKDLQQNMLDFAAVLEKQAYRRYQTGHQSITKRYGLTDETPLPPPTPEAPTPGTVKPRPKVGDAVTFQGKRYRVKAIENNQAVLEPIP